MKLHEKDNEMNNDNQSVPGKVNVVLPTWDEALYKIKHNELECSPLDEFVALNHPYGNWIKEKEFREGLTNLINWLLSLNEQPLINTVGQKVQDVFDNGGKITVDGDRVTIEASEGGNE